MPIPTPFHSRTSRLCKSLLWKEWAGYYAVKSYGICHEPEYFAIRHGAGLIDVSPLFKYEVKGTDAAAFLSRVMVKDIRKLKVGRVTYLCWCDDEGFVIDDGTVTRLGEHHYRVTAAEPSLSWFHRFTRGYDVTIEDSSLKLGTLALQGPNARDVLKQLVDADMDNLRFFAATSCKMDTFDVWITRTGYTGDLGYELWIPAQHCERAYDLLIDTGTAYGVSPVGIDAMDVARVEAGFIMNGVDYFSAHHCLTDLRKNTPYELGLGWAVQLKREPFVGRAALSKEREEGSKRLFVGLDVDWVELEETFAQYGLPPEVCSQAWRDGRPVYDQSGEWIGQATSGAWSPTLKKNLALAQVRAPFAKEGTKVKFELTVEYHRHVVEATVVKTPFFNPERKRA